MDKVFEKLKENHAEKRLNDDDTKRTAAVVDRFAFDDTTFVIIIRYFKKPTEFADPIYQAYIDDSRTDSTVMRIQTEKSIDLFGKGEELHMLCGWQGKAHLNFGPITRNGKIKYEEFKERLMGILEKKRKPGITTTTNKN